MCKGWIPAGLAWLLSVLIVSYTLTTSWHWRTVSVHLSPNCGHLCDGHGKFWTGSIWSKLSSPGKGRICRWLFVADVCLSCDDVGEQLFKSQDCQRLQTSVDMGSVISPLRPWHCCLISAICDYGFFFYRSHIKSTAGRYHCAFLIWMAVDIAQIHAYVCVWCVCTHTETHIYVYKNKNRGSSSANAATYSGKPNGAAVSTWDGAVEFSSSTVMKSRHALASWSALMVTPMRAQYRPQGQYTWRDVIIPY